MKNRSVRFKLFSLISVMLILSMVIAGIGLFTSKDISHQYSVVSNVNLPNTRNASLMISRYRLARALATQLGVRGQSVAETTEVIEQYHNAWKDFESAQKDYLALDFLPGEEEIYKKFEAAYKVVRAELDDVVSIYEEGSKKGQIDYDKILELIRLVQKNGGEVRKHGNELMTYHEHSAEKAVKIAGESYSKGMSSIALVFVVGAIGSIIYAFLFVKSLVSLLTGVSQKLTDSGAQVSSGATQIASTAQELSQATTEQSASLQETAASIEEMASTIQKSAENAKLTNDYAINSKISALEGQKIVHEMINAVSEIDSSNQNISRAVEDSNKKMVEIAKVIEEIGTKTKVINDIVFQTKLLSFNASVEAARAGEQGKGFAVVAEEVGNLAEMSGKAAKEISDMLNSSIGRVEDMVQTTKATVDQLMLVSKNKVEVGTVVAKKCEDILDSIVSVVENVTRLSSEISLATEEQSKGIQEISKATGMLESVTQQNSTASNQAANAAEDLSRQANQLNQIVNELNVVIYGS